MKIKKCLFYLTGLILADLLLGCRPATRSVKDLKEPYKILEGTWYLNRTELYHRIYFQDSVHVGFDTPVDTIFFYKYALLGDTLELYDEFGEMVNQNIILKLDRDSLVFANLLDKAGIQRYSRIKQEEKQETDQSNR